MSRSIFKFGMFFVALAGAACSDDFQTNKEVPYVTNAEYVLERIELGRKAAVAFHVKPIRTTSCDHMYFQIGQKDSNGQWRETNSLFPGKDNRDNFGQKDIKDQIHFAEVDGEGEFGVLALGCKPYGGNLKAIAGLLATFDVQPGRLNYVGEIALVPIGSGPIDFFTAEVADRSEFALAQIQTELPDLAPHFESSIMVKYVEEISPEQRAEIDARVKAAAKAKAKAEKRIANRNRLIGARNALVEKLKIANRNMEIWEANNDVPPDYLSDDQLEEFRKLRRASGFLILKIERYNDWIKRDVNFSITQEFIRLENRVEQARKNRDNKFPDRVGTIPSYGEPLDPERVRLTNEILDADEARRNYEKLHDL